MSPTDQSTHPALTPEEWRTMKARYHVEDGPDYVEDKDVEIGPSGQSVYVSRCLNGGTFESVGLRGDQLIATMAFANHALPDGDPRKITREDVRTIQVGADLVVGEHPAYAVRLSDIAAKLAALLPPE